MLRYVIPSHDPPQVLRLHTNLAFLGGAFLRLYTRLGAEVGAGAGLVTDVSQEFYFSQGALQNSTLIWPWRYVV